MLPSVCDDIVSECDDLESLKQQILSHKENTETSIYEIGRLLTVAKSMLAHGEFLPWLKRNIDIKPRTAQSYMQIYEAIKNTPAMTHLGVARAKLLLPLDDDERAKFIEAPHVVNAKGNPCVKTKSPTLYRKREIWRKQCVPSRTAS
ncbi:MAG: DUF3102 domain-containing protein [Lachnospiraceae bacterium]|nr:DUF3102 domain-containing protein [Lachnospiraceae bacterium]